MTTVSKGKGGHFGGPLILAINPPPLPPFLLPSFRLDGWTAKNKAKLQPAHFRREGMALLPSLP
jgi:hypothetical protein